MYVYWSMIAAMYVTDVSCKGKGSFDTVHYCAEEKYIFWFAIDYCVGHMQVVEVGIWLHA